MARREQLGIDFDDLGRLGARARHQLGITQHVGDAELVSSARAEAQAIVAGDPELLAPRHARLRERLVRLFGEELSWRATG